MQYFVSRETWWHRYWVLRRKLNGYEVAPTANDCRKAAILLQFAERAVGSSAPQAAQAAQYLSEVVLYGSKARQAALKAASKAAACVGATAGDVAPRGR